MVNTPEGLEPRKYIEAEISFTNTDPISMDIRDLDGRIKGRYLDPRIFSVATVVFWIGICMTVLRLFMPDVAQQPPKVSGQKVDQKGLIQNHINQ